MAISHPPRWVQNKEGTGTSPLGKRSPATTFGSEESTYKKRRLTAHRYRAILESNMAKAKKSDNSFSELKHKIHHVESVALAKNNFEGNKQQVESVGMPYERKAFSPKDITHKGLSQPALCDHEEIEQAEIRECQTRVPRIVVTDCLHEGNANIVTSDHVEMVEESQLCMGHTDAAKVSMQGWSSKTASSDHQESGPEQGVVKEDPLNVVDTLSEGVMHERSSNTLLFNHEELEEGEIRKSPDGEMSLKQLSLVEKGMTPYSEDAKVCQNIELLKYQPFKRKVELINTVCSRRLEELLSAQKLEAEEFRNQINKEKRKLFATHHLDLVKTCAKHIDPAIGNDEMELLKHKFSDKLKQFEQYVKCQRKELAVMHIHARNKEKQLKDQWLKEADAGELVESFDKLPLSATGFRLEKFMFSEQGVADDSSGNANIVAEPSHLERRPVGSGRASDSVELTNASIEVPSNVSNNRMEDVSLELENPSCQSIRKNAMDPVEPSREIPCDGSGNKLLETERSSSQCNVMIVTANGPDRAHNNSDTSTVDKEKPGGADSHGAQSSLPQQSHINSPSLDHASEPAGCETLCPSHDIAFPSLFSGDEATMQAEPSNVNHLRSDPILSQLPSSIRSVPCIPDHAKATPMGSEQDTGGEQERCNQTHCSTQLTEASTQRLVVSTAVEIEQSNNSFSQSFALPLPSLANSPLESTLFEHLRTTTGQQDSTSHLPILVAQSMPQDSLQGLHSDPLQNELVRFCDQERLISQIHKDKKFELQLACEKELEDVRRKYDALMQAANAEFIQSKKEIQRNCSFIHKNQILAEEFRETFCGNNGRASMVSQGGPSISLPQFSVLPQPDFTQRPVSVSAPAPTLSSLMLPRSAQRPVLVSPPAPIISSLTMPRSAQRPILVSPATATPTSTPSLPSLRHRAPPTIVHHTTAVFTDNSVGPHVSPVLLRPCVIHEARSEPRAPAPHLRSLRLSQSQQNPSLHNSQMTNQLPATTHTTTSLQSGGPGGLPPGTSPAIDFSPGSGGSHIENILLKLPELADVGPEFEKWLSTYRAKMSRGQPSSQL